MISSLDMSSMSGVTTVSSNGSDKSPRVNKKLKFATTKEVRQYQVPTGLLHKKVINPAKKKQKKEEFTKQVNYLQSHIDKCKDPIQKAMFTKLLNGLIKKKKKEMFVNKSSS